MSDYQRVRDSKAEALEAKGLYRRAASRWLDVMSLYADERDREWVASRRARCIDLARLPPQQAENFGGLSRAAKETQHRMGIAQPGGEAFRLPGKKK
ncbi:PerC family transcriptional regulator [Buttiauxella noackiae]|uniref:PerC family transcriptional regulator n=1 Tax=Buttiauxella noackiae TaxID=82992 RepID=UPI0028D77541|nr:PerC family transcriptional regulator [Buttiauxella noackiae]